MKVSDFELDYSNGGFTCCSDFISTNDSKCKVGEILTCEHCNHKLILKKVDGVLKWTGYDE